MTKLKPASQPQMPLPDNVACDICGKLTPRATTYSLSANFNMPGGPALPAYQCPNLQHYGCCMAHAIIATFACALEHLDQGSHAAHGKAWRDAGVTAIESAIEAYAVQVGGNGI